MGLFRKNPNEKLYPGGKKHFTEVIKNRGRGDLLFWKQPEEDFNTNSTLVVMPGEQAIFINKGQVEQVFTSGTYKLTTKNYPFISRLVNAFSGGVSRFNCVVYFVKSSQSMEIRWGTDSPIQVRDKLLGIATKLKARGAYRVEIKDAVKFLQKIVGANRIAFEKDDLDAFFVSEFQGKIKTLIAKAIENSQAEILGIDSRLEELSQAIHSEVSEILTDYGLNCITFAVSAIDLVDDALRRKYDEIGMEGIEKIRNAQADKAVFGVLGEDWQRQKSVEIMQTAVEKQGATGIHTVGMGLGMGVAMAENFGGMAKQMFSPDKKQEKQEEDYVEKLANLKKMMEMGLIEPNDYEQKKKEILSKI